MSAAQMNSAVEQRQLPAELLHSAPREVTFNTAGKALAMLAVFLGIGALAAAIGLYSVYEQQMERYVALTTEGESTQARILQVGRTREDRPRRFVVYEFIVSGQPYRGRSVLRRGDRRELPIGSVMDIVYVPSHPDWNSLPGYDRRPIPFWLIGVIPVGLLVPIAPIAYKLKQERRLLSEGRPALATVKSATRIQHQKSRYFRIVYEFRLLSGAVRTGRYDTAKQAPPVGSTLTVIYEKDRPECNAPYPLKFVRTQESPHQSRRA